MEAIVDMQAEQVAPDAASGIALWPIPPFFRLGTPLVDSHVAACIVELLNGRSIVGDLLSFQPLEGIISLAIADREGHNQLHLDSVRTIRLTTPLLLVHDDAVITSVGTDASQVAEERACVVHFRDGKDLTGTTRGFIKEKIGLFLYLLEGDPSQVVRCFVPAQQISEVHIGPHIGQTLVRNKQLSDTVLAKALDQQATLRQKKIGEHLFDHGIVSANDLERALQAQKYRPAVKLGELLLEGDQITPAQLAEALKLQTANRRRHLGDILVAMGAVTVRQIHMALADKLGIPFVNVGKFHIDPAAMQLLGANVATRYRALPLVMLGDSLVVAVEDPLAMDFVQDLRFLTGKIIIPVVADPTELRRRIAREYASLALSNATVEADSSLLQDTAGGGPGNPDVHVEELASALDRATAPPSEIKENTTDPRVTDNALVRLVNKIIIDAYTQGASDIHIENNAGKAITRIRFRKDGELEDYLDLQPVYSNALVSRIKIMANLDISEHRHGQDGKIVFGKVGAVAIDLRVVIVPTSDNREDVVLRLLGGVEPMPIERLGLYARDLAELQKMIARSYGLILVCGPTGSGKTTTLHSILHHINRPDIKIWTAEDPIEITQAGLRQVQINARIDWTFAAAMREFLRADPDVIMVGEMRDAETTKIGIEASLTGHLVFSTIHTNSAAESVVRLLDLGMDPFNFADALIGILSQRLARQLCPKCKRPHPCSELEIADLLDEYCAETNLDRAAVLAQWRKDFVVDGVLVLYEAVGCDACRDGYKGRIGVYELLSATPEVKQLMRSRATVPQIVVAARAGGMRLLRQDAIERTLRGILDRASARTASS
jgi:type II secretory ATPase GspE/PulE/Tfp pilus assembly ATPase PilB-like protein